MSKITVTTIAGQTSGSDANLVKIESGDTLQALSNATVGGTLGVTGALSAKGGAVFNEDSADVDFRVESNGNANMLFVDGGNDNVNIGTNSNIAPANGTNLYVEDGTIARFGLSKTGSNARKFSIGNAGTYLNIYDETLDAEVFRIDNSGRVTMPSQPCFSATHPSGSQLTTDTTYRVKPHNTIITNVGNCYSTAGGGSRFTAPVAGTYMFTCFALQLANVSSNLIFGKNGSHTTMGSTGEIRAISGSDEANIAGQVILTLAENDYVEVFYRRTGGSGSFYAAHGGFSGFLIG